LAFPKHSLIGWRRQMGASSTSRNFYDIKQLGRVRDADRYWRLDRNVRFGFHLGQEVPIQLLVCIEGNLELPLPSILYTHDDKPPKVLAKAQQTFVGFFNSAKLNLKSCLSDRA
jgi:hypothetical protein